MSKRVSYVLIGAAAMLSVGATGCKEDPPPPPITTAPDAQGSAAGSVANSPDIARAKGRPGGAIPRVDAATTKRNRLESCLWGSLGLRKTRDAYVASTKSGEPSADNLPEFGTFPENVKRAERMKEAGREPPKLAMNLPYLNHLRSCKHAKAAAGAKFEGVDEALDGWETYVMSLHETLVKSTRYYSREAFKKDDFKDGKIQHEKLMKLLPQFDEKYAAFSKAVTTWREANPTPAPAEKMDAGAKLTIEILAKASALADAVFAEKRDQAAIDALVKEVDGQRTELEKLAADSKRAPHPKLLPPKLAEFLEAVKATSAETGALNSDLSYPVSAHLALLFDHHQRALEQLLRQRAAGKGKPLRTLDPGAHPRRGVQIRK